MSTESSSSTNANAKTVDLRNTPGLPPLISMQERLWNAGTCVPVEEFAGDLLSPSNNCIDKLEQLLELVYNEIWLRRTLGQSPTLNEYQLRFPQLARPLAIQWSIDNYINSIDGTGEQQRTAAGDNDRTTLVDEPIPSSIGRFEIRSIIGFGGTGVVYEAWDPKLKRMLAIKRLQAGYHAQSTELSRLRSEAEAIARINHPNIVQVFEFGETNGTPFFAMEYCAGGSLSDYLKGKPLDQSQSVRLMKAIAHAVAAVHEARIVHRDLKPGNVLLEDSLAMNPKVADFGLAKLLDSEGGKTCTGSVFGTPNYMSPEQACGDTKNIGIATDIYSLGAIFYECLTGRPPYCGATAAETVEQVRSANLIPIRMLQPQVPKDLETLVQKCLRKHTSDRYVSVKSLIEDIENFLARRPINAHPPSIREQVVYWYRSNKVRAALLGTIVMSVCVTLGLLAFSNQRITEASNAKSVALAELVEANRQLETALRDRTTSQRLAGKRFYAAELTSASQAFRDNDVAQVRELLEHHLPVADQEDYREFAWRYLFQQINQGLLTSIKFEKEFIHDVEFSPDGTQLMVASGTKDIGKISIWDVATGTLVRRFGENLGSIESICFYEHGNAIIAGFTDGRVRKWGTVTGDESEVFSCSGPVRMVVASPDNRWIAAECGKGRICLWHSGELRLREEFSVSGESVQSLFFSPDSCCLYASWGVAPTQIGSIEFDLSKPMVGSRKIEEVQLQDISTDGKSLVGIRWGEVRVIDRDTLKINWSNTVSAGSLSEVRFVPASSNVIRAGSADRLVETWDTESSKLKARIAHLRPISTLAVSFRGDYWATGSEDGSVRIGYLRSEPEPIHFANIPSGIWRMRVTEDEHMFVGGPFFAEIFNGESGEHLGNLKMKFLHDVSTDGKILLAITPTPNSSEDTSAETQQAIPDHPALGLPETIEIWDRGADNPRIKFRLPDENARAWRAVAISPDGKTLATRQWGAPIRIWDISGTNAAQVYSFEAECLNLRYSNDGKYIAACCRGNAVRVINLETGIMLPPFVLEPSIAEWAKCAAFSRDSRKLVAGNGTGVVRVWEVESGREICQVSGNAGEVHDIDFFPEGRAVAICGVGPLSVWDVEVGQKIAEFSVPDFKLEQVSVARDGKTLYARSDAGALRFWKLNE